MKTLNYTPLSLARSLTYAFHRQIQNRCAFDKLAKQPILPGPEDVHARVTSYMIAANAVAPGCAKELVGNANIDCWLELLCKRLGLPALNYQLSVFEAAKLMLSIDDESHFFDAVELLNADVLHVMPKGWAEELLQLVRQTKSCPISLLE